MAQFWESAPIVEAPQGGPQPVFDLRDPTKAAGDQRDQTRTEIAVRSEQKGIADTAFNQKEKLFSNYNAEPVVKSYRVAMQQLSQALSTGDGPQADLALTYAFAKAMDPDSVVREAEQGMVANSQPWFQAAVEATKKQFGMDGAGSYTPEARRQIRKQIINSVASRAKIYDQRRNLYAQLAERNNFDPFEVVGDHDAVPYVEQLREFDQRERKPEQRGGLPVGTEVSFGGGGNTPFDRSGYLEQLGLDPNKEAQLVAGLNQLSGNPDLTAEQMIGMYAQLGVPLPDAQSLQQQLENARRGVRFGPIDTSAAEQAYRTELEQAAAQQGQGGFGERIDQGITLGLSDEIAGIGGFAGSLLRGDNPVEGYQRSRDVERLRNEQADQNTGLAGDVVEIGSSLALPFGAVRGPASALKVGAGYGATGGFGYGEGAGESIGNAAIGGALGGAIGVGGERLGSAIVNKLANRPQATQPTVDVSRIVQAGAEEGVPVNRAMVAPELSNKLTAAESTLAGGPVIRGGMQEVSEAIEGRVGSLSRGTALDPEIAGARVQGAIQRADKDMKTEVDRLYDSYRKASGDPPVTAQSALSQIDGELAELAKSPKTNAGEIGYLNDLKSDLSNSGLTVDTLLNLRRSMRGQISERNLGMTQAEARVQRVLDAAGDDIAKTLDPASPAYKFLQRANKAHGERQVFKRQVIKELIGTDKDLPIDPDKAFQKLMQWTKPGADGSRLIATWKKFTPEEAADVAATIAGPLGRDKGGVFSPALFVSQVDKLSPRARVTAFGPEGKQSIDNLIELSNQFKRVTGAYNNSKSGVAVNSSNVKQALLTGLGATGGGYAGGWTGMAVGATLASAVMGKSWLTARSLMNKDVSKWLLALSKKPNQPAAMAHIARLDNIAKAQPLIANEVIQLQSRLREAFAQSPEKLAANSDVQTAGTSQTANTTTEGEGR